MSWVSTAKLKTLCETIKTYVIGQADDAYTKAETKMSTDYVAKSGSTMTGALNVIDPVDDSNASTKKYVDDAIASVDHSTFLKKTGDTMSGTLDMGDNTITNVKTPTAVGDAANKSYVDEALASASGGYIQTFVKKSGDTMTGYLNMSHNDIKNVLSLSAEVVKAVDRDYSSYVCMSFDDNNDIAEFTTSAEAYSFNGVSSNPIPVNVGAPTGDTHATTKSYVDTQDALKVNTSDEMTDDELTTIEAIFA